MTYHSSPLSFAVGNVSGSIYDLPNLKELNFASNDISLSFSRIATARNLEYLNLDSTGLSSLGGIGQAQTLKLLHAVDNDFAEFPQEILSLSTLQILDLSENAIRSLPAGMASLSNLVFLSCSRCELDGNLPTFLASLPNLEYLRLDQNAFVGVLGDELAGLSKLKHLDLSKQVSSGGRGGLEGSVPSFSNFTQLTELYLNENQFTGPLTVDFLSSVDNTGSVTVDLTSNRLTGEIPLVLERFEKLSLYLADNLIDTIPSELCTLSWNEKSGSSADCDFILCDKGSSNGLGRATSALPCQQCINATDAPTYGSTDCGDAEEREILDMIYREAGGLGWIYSDGWTSHDHHCTWFGIVCYEGGLRDKKVQLIDLSHNNLQGSLPDSIWRLVYLTELKLRDNAVDASFAKIGNAQSLKSLILSRTNVKSLVGIGAATSLVSLHLTSNDIGGPLADELFDLVVLEKLFLNFNSFTGTLPTLIGQLKNLKEIYLLNNALNGTLPTELGRLIRINVISLGENNFSGEIPSHLSSLPFLEVLSLEKEQRILSDQSFGKVQNPGLTGNLPQFHRAAKLRELYLGSNSLEGTIPLTFLKGVQDKSAIIQVDLTSNGIHGSIPATLASFDDLRLYVADNQIHEIPDEICEKDWMDGLLTSGCDALLCPPGTYNQYGRRVNSEPCRTCDHRGLSNWYGRTRCGAILPETLTEAEILEEIYSATGGTTWEDTSNWLSQSRSVCSWKGIGCETDDQGNLAITKIDLSSNNLQGYVPSIVFYLPSLRSLNVAGNAVVLSFRDIEDAASLQEVFFGSTNVVSIEGIGQATNLRTLKMDNNAFYGRTIPEELYALRNLEMLDISNCGFTGILSSTIGSMTKIQVFRGANNDLSGELPSAIGSLGQLKELTLSESNFYGSLPGSFQSLMSLQSISLDARTRKTAGLSGPMLSFSGLAHLRIIDFGGNSLTGSVPSDLLQAVDSPNDIIDVRVDSNLLTGSVPADLASRFTRLNIDLTGNEITTIPDGFCDQIPQWLDGDVGRYSCRGLLCPLGTYNEFGRQTSEENRCYDCPDSEDAPYLGSRICPSVLKAEAREILKLLFQQTGGPKWKRKDGWLNDNEDICDWYGVSCRDGGSVESIILGSNNLIGRPPKELFEIFELTTLWLYSNPIDVSFQGIENAKTLTSLQLDSTGLKSLSGIGNAPSLVDVDVRFNRLSGPLPSEMDKLVNLETFFCGDNDLSGRFPSFAANRKLTTLRCGGNDFAGPLPSFNIHPNLKTLDVSNNQLVGAIPKDFLAAANPNKPIFIDVSSNLISGILPGSLSRFSQVTLYARDNRIEGIDADLCAKDSWNGGDVGLFDCDGILCPVGSYSPLGRASDNDSKCLPCKKTEYFGSSQCNGLRSSSWSSYLVSRYVVAIAAMVTCMHYYS